MSQKRRMFSPQFKAEAVIAEFGLIGGYIALGGFTPEKSSQVQAFCRRVVDAYQAALTDSVPPA